MPDPLRPADLSGVRTEPLADRRSKVGVAEFGRPSAAGDSLAAFLDGLPDVLGARTLRRLAAAVVDARAADRPVVWATGGHLIKVGASPIVIELMRRGRVTALVLNGAAAIHDWEIAAVGKTSETVEDALAAGRFGMAEETGRALNDAAAEAARSGRGFGEVLAERTAGLPHAGVSLLAASARLGVPLTIHVAIGADIVHQHPAASGEAIGAATFTDFRRLVSLIADLSGGVWINCGSAVQLPEVFLKALSVARNLGHEVAGQTMANLDMVRHYRTDENVLRRPLIDGGQGLHLSGHHEINVPLLAAAIERAAARLDER